MTPFTLKDYQRECLKTLGEYLSRAREIGPAAAFDERPERDLKYRPIPDWNDSATIPYVCTRVPTGGGKTILAAYSVGVACKRFLHQERCVVLWLAPSGAIVEQTEKALRNRNHPYRRALDEAFGGDVEILAVDQALYVQRPTLDAKTVVILSTIQNWRVEETDDRSVYKNNGYLEHFFEDGAARQALLAMHALDELGNEVSGGGAGFVPYSLANVLRMRGPIVIMDEAHNARTPLSFSMLKRLAPRVVLEFTATPGQHGKGKIGSNVLVSVSAADLKAEDMIKLPIRLVERTNWQEAVTAAIAKRNHLEGLCGAEQKATGEYIRPILLLQAQPQSQDGDTITAEKLKEHLVNDHEGIAKGEVAIATGTTWELEDDLLTQGSKVRYIITVSKLKEGWDCPWAYVLCSVSNLGAATAVEQLLGRVMRLPNAVPKQDAELNMAYAYACSPRFGAAANSLKDALVESGFEKFEAQTMIELSEADAGQEGVSAPLPLFTDPIAEPIAVAPAQAELAKLPTALRRAVQVQSRADTSEVEVIYQGPPLSNDAASILAKALGDKRVAEKIRRRSWGQSASPSDLGELFTMPFLAIEEDGELSLFDSSDAEVHWMLADCNAELDAAEFSARSGEAIAETIDIDKAGRLAMTTEYNFQEQLLLRDLRGPKTAEALSRWIDHELDVPQQTLAERREFVDRAVAHVLGSRRISIEDMLPLRWKLVETIQRRIDNYRIKAEHEAYQAMLLPDGQRTLTVDPSVAFTFPNGFGAFAATRLCEGESFRKHYYAQVPHMNGEEMRCARLIDADPNVEYWTKNIVSPRAFWLPMPSGGRFYPDFAIRLRDGRKAAIEYKGKGLLDKRETETKELIGRLWQDRSNSQCVFAMVNVEDMQTRVASVLAAK